MPILDSNGRCVGLIDAESWTPDFFDEARVAIVARCALDLASELAITTKPLPSDFAAWWWTVGGCAIMVTVAFAYNVLSHASEPSLSTG